VDEARTFLRRIGAEPLLTRLDRAAADATADVEA
jgi:hypothetical protein